jgi:hypothetical protein
MITPNIPQFHRHRKPAVRSARRPAPPATVTIVGIDFDSNNRLVWEFSSEVVSVEGTCPQLQADDGRGGGMRSPDAITDVEENIVIALYNDLSFEGSCSWQVLAPPVGIVFADGTLIVPESGSAG